MALDRFRSRVASLGLAERVEFTGSVERAGLPGLLKEAAAFALPRASGLFSTAGFPTKLGEYLATGKPVVVATTGDIPLYLSDGVDAFFVPDDTRAFAARLAEMFADRSAKKQGGRAWPRDGATALRHRVAVKATRSIPGRVRPTREAP